jgi:hypothetical protein
MWSTFIFYRLEQTRCHAGALVPNSKNGGFRPKTTTSDLWNKTRTHFAGTGSTQNPVGKKIGFIPDFQSSGQFPATVFPLRLTQQHRVIIIIIIVVVPFCHLLLLQ